MLIGMLQIALIYSLVAGLYGILHDQVTFTISNEYFTKLKYQQFHYLSFDGSDRLRVSVIGFFATFWAGLLFGWFLARWFLPNCSLSVARGKIFKASIIIFSTSILFAIAAGAYGLFSGATADHSSWSHIFNTYCIENTQSFVNVAYIHNSSYLGALVGLLITLVCIKRKNEF